MSEILSTRRQSRLSNSFVRSTRGSQSLERGLHLLRMFRPGSAVLTNSELALRSGLPKPTVSRLTRSLVDAGFLTYDHAHQGYRLGVACLSLALAFRTAHEALDLALPLMREVAEGRRINVGLAVLDQTEMVYLDSVRLSRLGIFRRLVPGSRIPAALTSLGRAYMSTMAAPTRQALLARLAPDYGAEWRLVHRDIQVALRSIKERGYCSAQWQAGSLAVAMPIRQPTGEAYALNISLAASELAREEEVEVHGNLLKELGRSIEARWATA